MFLGDDIDADDFYADLAGDAPDPPVADPSCAAEQKRTTREEKKQDEEKKMDCQVEFPAVGASHYCPKVG